MCVLYSQNNNIIYYIIILSLERVCPTLPIQSNSYMLEAHSKPPIRGESNIS